MAITSAESDLSSKLSFYVHVLRFFCVIQACAHRYKIIGTNYKWGMGMCYIMTSDFDLDAVQEPCAGKPYDDGHKEFGFCQAGTSAQFTVVSFVVCFNYLLNRSAFFFYILPFVKHKTCNTLECDWRVMRMTYSHKEDDENDV